MSSNAFRGKTEGRLVITGDYGCGKTHLAVAIANSRENLVIRRNFSSRLICWIISEKHLSPNNLNKLQTIDSKKSELHHYLSWTILKRNPLTPWGLEKL